MLVLAAICLLALPPLAQAYWWGQSPLGRVINGAKERLDNIESRLTTLEEQDSADLESRVEALERKQGHEDLEGRIATLEERQESGQQDLASRITALENSGQIDALANRIAALEDSTTQLNSLASRITVLEDRQGSNDVLPTLHAIDANGLVIGSADIQQGDISQRTQITLETADGIALLSAVFSPYTGPGQIWTDQAIYFSGTNCSGDAFISVGSGRTQEDPRHFGIAVVFDGDLYTADSKVVNFVSQSWAHANNGIVCDALARSTTGYELNFVEPWPYDLPMTVELR